jgi:hypothetical protein
LRRLDDGRHELLLGRFYRANRGLLRRLLRCLAKVPIFWVRHLGQLLLDRRPHLLGRQPLAMLGAGPVPDLSDGVLILVAQERRQLAGLALVHSPMGD